MSQNSRLIQIQREAQLQKLTPQQMLEVRLTEMSIADLEERVKNEVDENEALDEAKLSSNDTSDDPNFDGDNEGGQESATQIEIGEYGSEDDIPDYLRKQMDTAFSEPQPIGEATTFLQDLESQLIDYDLSEHQRELIEYLIGSLDDNGFIDQPLSRIVDEMLFKHDIETDETELEEALHILQQFDPAGIGARSSLESLLLQIDRQLEDANKSEEKKKILRLERQIVADEYENFKNRNYDKLSANLNIDKAIISYAVEDMVKHLNPRPGRALCESAADQIQTAIPDFIVETDSEGQVSFMLNRGNVPMLQVSKEYQELVQEYQNRGEKMSRRSKEGLMYYKHKIDAAQSFIDAIRTRQHTLKVTMRAIIALQKRFFQSQDEEDLQSLIYKDVAETTGLDISTISRVCKTKYALVNGRMYPLSYFFKHNRKNSKGEEVDSDKISVALKEIVDSEDKHKPLTDDQLVEALKKRGINVARRTVNKYRTQLAIPTATKRKA